MKKALFTIIVLMTLGVFGLNAQIVVDFTKPVAQGGVAVYGTNAQIQIAGSNTPSDETDDVFGLRAGDGNGDGLVDAVDLILFWLSDNGKNTNYTIESLDYNAGADFNLDGLIDAVDLILFWLPNNGSIAQIPK